MERLRALALDDAAYGHLLSTSLFADPAVQMAYAQARSAAQTLKAPLRLRLFIAPSASELHNLRWETQRDPQDDSSLLTSEHILFSRYLNSLDWRPVRLRPPADLHALVAIANPTDVASHQPGGRPLAALDVAGELARAKTGLGRNYVRHQYPNQRGSSLLAATKIDPTMPDEAVDVDYMMEHMWMVGDPQECADRLRKLYEAAGGFGNLLAIT